MFLGVSWHEYWFLKLFIIHIVFIKFLSCVWLASVFFTCQMFLLQAGYIGTRAATATVAAALLVRCHDEKNAKTQRRTVKARLAKPLGCGGALPEVNRKGDYHYCKNNGTLSRRNGSRTEWDLILYVYMYYFSSGET